MSGATSNVKVLRRVENTLPPFRLLAAYSSLKSNAYKASDGGEHYVNSLMLRFNTGTFPLIIPHTL